jgi:hypothetical protein
MREKLKRIKKSDLFFLSSFSWKAESKRRARNNSACSCLEEAAP